MTVYKIYPNIYKLQMFTPKKVKKLECKLLLFLKNNAPRIFSTQIYRVVATNNYWFGM
jgi:hypothetical protein